MTMPENSRIRVSITYWTFNVVAILITVILIYLILLVTNASIVAYQISLFKSILHNDVKSYERPSKLREIDSFAIKQSRCVVLLRNINGRLGNRMFMFASAYGLARTHACKLYIAQHILNELQTTFDISVPHLVTKAEMKTYERIVSRNTLCNFFPELMTPKVIQYFELTGYWQSFRYFIHVKHEILDQFSFQSSVLAVITPMFLSWKYLANNCCFGHCSMSLANYTEKMCSVSQNLHKNVGYIQMSASALKLSLSMSNFTWIGVHVRRTDFYKEFMSDDAYVFNAMKYFSEKYRNCIFNIASDAKDYCTHTFGKRKNVIITPRHFSSNEDLAVLSSCQHSIVTGGTFGWWSAFLAGGDVLHDNRYMQNRSVICDCDPETYFPPWFIFPK